MDSRLQEEIEYRRKNQLGFEFNTISQLNNELKKIGYQLDRLKDCQSIARWLTGERAGKSYPCITTGIKEIDTGKSAFHYQARRDKNFEKLQKFRIIGAYVVIKGKYILEI